MDSVDSAIHQIIRRSNRNVAIRTLIGFVIVIGGIAIFSRYLINFFQGPYDMTGKEILSITDIGSEPEYFVTVTGDDSFDSGYSLFEGEKVIASYAALQFQDQLLLVKTNDDLERDIHMTYTGQLVKVPGDVQREVINDIYSQYPDLQGMFLPFMMETDGFRTGGYIGLAIGGVILLLSLYGAYLFLTRSSNHGSHPIMKALERFGSSDGITAQIDSELKQPDHQQYGKQLHTTRNWVISMTKSSLNATRYTDMVWFYKKITTHRTNFVVTSRDFEVIILDRYGKEIHVKSNKNEVDDLLTVIYKRVPWVLIGYDEQLKQLWNKERAKMIAAVDQRRKDYAAQPPSQESVA